MPFGAGAGAAREVVKVFERFSMIARRPIRSLNRKAVPVDKTLVDYLNDKDAILDKVIKILSREYNAIK